MPGVSESDEKYKLCLITKKEWFVRKVKHKFMFLMKEMHFTLNNFYCTYVPLGGGPVQLM